MAKSIADKCDFGGIMLDATQEDRESLDALVKELGCEMPNVKMSVYKNRRGEYNKFFLWMVADKGTCRYNPIFATDYEFNYIHITDVEIEVRE